MGGSVFETTRQAMHTHLTMRRSAPVRSNARYTTCQMRSRGSQEPVVSVLHCPPPRTARDPGEQGTASPRLQTDGALRPQQPPARPELPWGRSDARGWLGRGDPRAQVGSTSGPSMPGQPSWREHGTEPKQRVSVHSRPQGGALLPASSRDSDGDPTHHPSFPPKAALTGTRGRSVCAAPWARGGCAERGVRRLCPPLTASPSGRGLGLPPLSPAGGQ